MTEHIQEGDSIRGRMLIFEGRKVGNVQLFRRGGRHRGQRVKLEDGICRIERPIRLAGNN